MAIERVFSPRPVPDGDGVAYVFRHTALGELGTPVCHGHYL